MQKFSADYIFPISSPPIKYGVVITDEDGAILDVLASAEGLEDVKHFEGIICPGFVNTHCHLELSYLKEKIPEKNGLIGFIKNLNDVRFDFSDEEMIKSMVNAQNEMLNNGIVAVGDISNSSLSFPQKEKGLLKYHSFIEALGLLPERAVSAFETAQKLQGQLNVECRSSIVPHGPYSISERLFQKIAVHNEANNEITCIHNQESEEENKMFFDGKSQLLDLFENYFGFDVSFWKPIDKSSLRAVFKHLHNAKKVLLVHNTFTSNEDIEFLKGEIGNRKSKIYFCLCPNANLYIENRLPDVYLLMKSGFPITVGTDSLASNWQLSILEELKTLQQHFPQVSLSTMLEWATKNGAEFLEFEELGSIEKGRNPGLNLIKNVALKEMKLTKNSRVSRLI